MLNLSFPPVNYVNIKYSGSINVTHEVKGDIELVMEGNRCTLDMKTCEKNNNLNVGGICQKFHDKNAFYSSLFDNIKPRLKCPIKPGIYMIEEGFLDLSLISLLPLDGYIYVCAFKLAYGEKGSRAKKVAMCLNTETKIFKTHKKSWFFFAILCYK